MAPGSGIVRGRVQSAQTTGGTTEHGPDSDDWGGYPPELIFDNENFDDPRHEWSLEQLAAQPPGLRVVRYQNQDPSKDELLALFASPMFAAVEYLDLRRNFRSPSDAEWAEIVASGVLSHVRLLGLDSCYGVGDATLAAIGSGAMPNLEALEIGSTDVTAAGLAALTDADKTPALSVVQGMFMGELTQAGVEAADAARPGLTLRFTMG